MKVPKVTLADPYPPGRPWNRPPCEARVANQTARWRQYVGRNDKCSFYASYIVDGQKLCERHAGKVLLQKLLRKS